MRLMKKISISSIFFLLLSSFFSICLAAEGKKLYVYHCASCHGTDGEGGKGLALNRQSFLVLASDSYIARSILNGRPTRGCPPRKDLSKEEITLIASFIKSWQKEETIAVSANKVLPVRSERGEELFNICAGCHDNDGAGAMGPSLLDPGFQASASDGFIRGTIIYGRKGTPMTGFSSKSGHEPPLSEDDIEELVAYIRYLGIEKGKNK